MSLPLILRLPAADGEVARQLARQLPVQLDHLHHHHDQLHHLHDHHDQLDPADHLHHPIQLGCLDKIFEYTHQNYLLLKLNLVITSEWMIDQVLYIKLY